MMDKNNVAHKIAIIYQRDKWCLRCGTTVLLTIDHILPKSRGGTWDIENLQTLCKNCNQWKGSKHISYIGKQPDKSLQKIEYPIPNKYLLPVFKIVGKIDLTKIKERKKIS